MLNQPPTNPQPSSTEADKPADPAVTPGQSPAKPYSTVEEAEAHWQNRLSGRDRAHNAAEQALRDEIARLQAQQSASAGQSGSTGTPEDPAVKALRLRAEAAESTLKEEKQRNEALARKAKYPALAASGVTDDVFAITDDATLARLNALADGDSGGGDLIAPTSPARKGTAPPKPLTEMSKEELEAHLKGLTDAGAHLRG